MRLRHSNPDGPGIHRTRRGRGFSYADEHGKRTTDEAALERIRALVIPPAWQSVWICPYPNGHIQAVGVDVAGRRQYIYHEQWRSERDEEKHDRVLLMARRLGALREQVEADLRMRGITKRRVEAVALRMLDRGVFRVGGEEYADENGTHGVATLLRSQVRLSGDRVSFDYPAKGGIRRQVAITDHLMAVAIRALRRASKPGSDRLLIYRAGSEYRELHADDVNVRFKELAGDDCSAKDLRTWHATVLAAAGLGTAEVPDSERQRRKVVTQVMKDVAVALGNTPAVARSSYVDPRVISAYEDGSTIRPALRRARKSAPDEQQDVIERAVLRLVRPK